MAPITLLSVDRGLAGRLSGSLGGQPVSMMQKLAPRDEMSGPSVIVLDASAIPAERSLASAIAAIVDQAPGYPVVLAAERRNADLVLSAIRAGASDVIDRGDEGEEVGQVLARLQRSALADPGRGGSLTLVLGADPETAAILATDLAIAKAAGRQNHLLIDCTLPSSAAEAYLDLSGSYGIATAVLDVERLDSILLSNALSRHDPSGLLLLTFDGGTGAEPPGIAPADIAGLIRRLRSTCEDVVLCAGSLRHGGLLRELAMSADRIELVATQSIRDLEACRRLLERIGADAAVADRTRLLLWDHHPSILLDGQRMAEALGLGRHAAIPVDPVRFRNALNAGRPLALDAPLSPYMQAIRRLGSFAEPARPFYADYADRLLGGVKRLVERRA